MEQKNKHGHLPWCRFWEEDSRCKPTSLTGSTARCPSPRRNKRELRHVFLGTPPAPCTHSRPHVALPAVPRAQ